MRPARMPPGCWPAAWACISAARRSSACRWASDPSPAASPEPAPARPAASSAVSCPPRRSSRCSARWSSASSPSRHAPATPPRPPRCPADRLCHRSRPPDAPEVRDADVGVPTASGRPRVSPTAGRGEAEVGVAVRAVRGATRVDVDDREHILTATRELVAQLLERNELEPQDVVSIVFTATRDLTAVAPALAARQLGLHDVALICAQAMWVGGSVERVGGLLAHIETARPREAAAKVSWRGPEVLGGDVPPIAPGETR